jgi:hypothetical protein
VALENFKVSPLPRPPAVYDHTYFNQFIRTLELYFAQLESLTPNQASSYRADLFIGSGVSLTTPKAQFTSVANQTAASTAASYAVSFDATLYADGVSLVSGSRITFAAAGTYNIAYSLQAFNPSTTTPESLRVWLKKNNTNVPLTARNFGVPQRKGVGVDSYAVASSKIMVTVAAADYVEVMWAVSDTAVGLGAYAAAVSPAVPTTPSAVVSVDFAVAA